MQPLRIEERALWAEVCCAENSGRLIDFVLEVGDRAAF
jgi:hypothetical protein